MILLSYLKGVLWLDCSKGRSVHVSACIIYDFNALTPIVRKLCVFLCPVARLSDRFQSSDWTLNFVNILSKINHWIWNMVLSIWSLKLTTKFTIETANILTIQGSSHVEITNKDTVRHFLRYQGYCSLWIHSTRPNSQPSLLWGNTEAVTWSCG
jgi:hypothetical protein